MSVTETEAAELNTLAAPVEQERDLDDPEIYPLLPGIDTRPREFEERFVAYSGVAAGDVVLSGPISGGWGPGRYHRGRREARARLEEKFGAHRVVDTEHQTLGRWSFIIKGLRKG